MICTFNLNNYQPKAKQIPYVVPNLTFENRNYMMLNLTYARALCYTKANKYKDKSIKYHRPARSYVVFD